MVHANAKMNNDAGTTPRSKNTRELQLPVLLRSKIRVCKCDCLWIARWKHSSDNSLSWIVAFINCISRFCQATLASCASFPSSMSEKCDVLSLLVADDKIPDRSAREWWCELIGVEDMERAESSETFSASIAVDWSQKILLADSLKNSNMYNQKFQSFFNRPSADQAAKAHGDGMMGRAFTASKFGRHSNLAPRKSPEVSSEPEELRKQKDDCRSPKCGL